jgi:hypothetical protein
MGWGRCHAYRSIIQLTSGPKPHNLVFPSALTSAHLALAAAASFVLVAGLLRRSFFLAAFTFAHRALVAAIMAALPVALNRLFFLAGLEIFAPVPLILAQRAFAAADILALTAADLRRFFGASSVDGIGISPPPAMESSWLCSFSIFSLIAIISLSWLVVKFVMFMGDF